MAAATRCLCLCSLLLLFAFPPRADAAVDAGHPLFRGTFIQLLDAHREWTPPQWQQLGRELRQAGMEEIFVQWSVFDESSLHLGDPPPLQALLDMADACGLTVWVGLVEEPVFWEMAASDTGTLESYLRQLRQRSLDLARRLVPEVQNRPCFRGWYIPQEIDDRQWLATERRRLLRRYLQELTTGLRMASPTAGIAVSGFSNGYASPRVLQEFWTDLLSSTTIDRLLFQDGIGTGKLEMEELPLFLAAARRACLACDRELQVIVEIFRCASGEKEEFAAAPAPLESILAQMKVAAAYQTAGLIAFSAPEYMSSFAVGGGAKLYRTYLDYVRQAAPFSPRESR